MKETAPVYSWRRQAQAAPSDMIRTMDRSSSKEQQDDAEIEIESEASDNPQQALLGDVCRLQMAGVVWQSLCHTLAVHVEICTCIPPTL